MGYEPAVEHKEQYHWRMPGFLNQKTPHQLRAAKITTLLQQIIY